MLRPRGSRCGGGTAALCMGAALVREGGGWLSSGREREEQVLMSETGQRAGRSQGQTVIGERWFAMGAALRVHACGECHGAETRHEGSLPDRRTLHGAFLSVLGACGGQAKQWGPAPGQRLNRRTPSTEQDELTVLV